MAISVRDIQEKEFGTQASGGYNIEQVDDFLDEISEQMATLVRENLELNKQIKALETDVKAARLAAEAARDAGVKGLVLTHFNPGGDLVTLLREARSVYPRAALAEAGLTVFF